MWTAKRRLHWSDWGILTGVVVLIGGEAAAIFGGIGPIGGVITLGFFIVLLAAYWLYRQERASDTPALHQSTLVAEVDVGPDTAGLRNVDIFKDLSNDQVRLLAELGDTVYAPAGERLGTAGEQGHQIFVVVAGMAQLSTRSTIGEMTIRIAGPGESFPLAVLIGPGILISSVRAMTDMEMLAIPRAGLLAAISNDPTMGTRIYAAISETLADRYSKTLAHLASRSAEGSLEAVELFANV